jgi:hypothetical protein
MGLDGLGEEHLLGDEAIEQRHAGHRGRRHHGERGRDRHGTEQAAEPPDIARAGFVIDDAGRHEERGLEGRVIDDVEDRRDHAERAAEPEQKGDEPEMADGGIGEEALQVLLEERHEGADEQRQHAHRGEDPEPVLVVGHHRP